MSTDAWVLVDGFQQRIAVFDSAGRTKKVLPIAGAEAIEADARGHVWVAAVTGIERKRTQLWDIDPADGSMLEHPFAVTTDKDDIEFHFDPTGTVSWLLTTSPKYPGRVDVWTIQNGIVRPFAYRRPKLWYELYGK